MHTLMHLAVLAGAVLLGTAVIPGVRVQKAPAVVLVAVVFSVLNWLLGFPLRLLLILPGFLSFGLVWVIAPLIVNAVLLWLTDKLLHVFEIQSAKALALMAGLITLANAAFRLAA